MRSLAYIAWLSFFWGFAAFCALGGTKLVNATGLAILVSATTSMAGFLYLWPQRWFEDKV